MGKIEYIRENAFWGLLSMFWFRMILFRCIQGHTLLESKLALWSIFLVFVSFGVLITFNHRRNNVSMIVNLLIPYEAYALITYFRDMSALSTVVLSVELVLSVLYFFMVMSPEIKDKAKKALILKRRTRFGLLGVRTISAFCLMAFIVPLVINAVFGNSLSFNKVAAEVPTENSEWTIANNISTVSNLRQEVWETLSLNQKSDTLQTICNIEANYLGLPHELNLIIEKISSESTVSQYDDRTHTVTVSINYLDKMEAEEILDAVCHEAYHAYQHRLVDAYDNVGDEYKGLLIFYSAALYKEEFASYTDGDDDTFGYYIQVCEATARYYAADAVEDYYDKINEELDTADLAG